MQRELIFKSKRMDMVFHKVVCYKSDKFKTKGKNWKVEIRQSIDIIINGDRFILHIYKKKLLFF